MLKQLAYCSAVLLLLLPSTGVASATWIDNVVLYDQPSGSSTSMNDPTRALGVNDGAYVSIDTPETLILSFAFQTVVDGPGYDIHVYEVGLDHSNIEIYGSLDGKTWTFLVKGEGDLFIDLSTSGLTALKYLKFLGVDDLGTWPGYDLDAVEALNSVAERNLALNKPVTIITNGANDYREGSGENPEDITDGAVGEHLFNGCVGFVNNDYNQLMIVEATIDLQGTYNISHIRYNIGNVHRANTWNADLMISPLQTTSTNPGGYYSGAWTTHSGSTSLSQVKVTFQKTRTSWETDWLFIGEIEVYGEEVTLTKTLDVPTYNQADFGHGCTMDCSPTAAAMILGYWDSHGWPRMVPGGSADYNKNPKGVTNLVMDLWQTMEYTCSDGTSPEKVAIGIIKTASNMDPGAQYVNHSFLEITTENKEAVFQILKGYIDNGWPVLFSSFAGLKYYLPNNSSYGELAGGHSMVMTGYLDGPSVRRLFVNSGWGFPNDKMWINYDDLGLDLSITEPKQIWITCVVPGGHPTSLFMPTIPLLLSDDTQSSQPVIVQPGPDAGVDVWVTYPYYDYGLDTWYLIAGGWGNEYYSLIKFDLNGLPANVSSAQIHLFCYNDTASEYLLTAMYLDRVTSAWNENTKWQTKPAYINLRTIPKPAVSSWYVIDITSLYNSWKSGAYENFGIQLRPVSTTHTESDFYSSDYMDNVSLRPKLVIAP